ncbi:Transcription initiation factor IIA subunit 2 [Cucumis melo var. makuwa]|uniref:Transcription initiation factor IIA subunit 2 n=1 Tax=Cucumis melo var. makuwa TaxID=1194695 RepID=A0A5D3C3W2_CUCMM|nr:Transcription initiation factor IIA subunit 2 [Cucumis melo var. makuwa]
MATFELYRRSTIGMCLTETLDEMVQNGTLSPELAIQVLVQFDKSMTDALESQVKSKVTIKIALFVLYCMSRLDPDNFVNNTLHICTSNVYLRNQGSMVLKYLTMVSQLVVNVLE